MAASTSTHPVMVVIMCPMVGGTNHHFMGQIAVGGGAVVLGNSVVSQHRVLVSSKQANRTFFKNKIN